MTDTPLSAWCAIALVLAIFVWGFRRTFKRRRKGWSWYRNVYLKSAHWRETSRRIRARDGGRCQDCGRRGNHVHHLTYANLWNERDDELVTLCASCHGKRHGKQR